MVPAYLPTGQMSYVRALTCTQERMCALSCFQAFEELSHEPLCDVCTVGSLPTSHETYRARQPRKCIFSSALTGALLR